MSTTELLRKGIPGLITLQENYLKRLRSEYAAGRIEWKELEIAMTTHQDLLQRAGLATDPAQKPTAPMAAERRAAPKGTRTPASTPTAAQRAKAAKAAKELKAWHQRRAAKAAQALADLEARLTTR